MRSRPARSRATSTPTSPLSRSSPDTVPACPEPISTISHDAPFVTFGAGSVVKSNTNTVRARVYHSFTGGLTVNAGEWDAQFRNAVGDGNVTVNGGTLRASAVDDEQYVLEVVGNLVFAGGSLAIGAAYVV